MFPKLSLLLLTLAGLLVACASSNEKSTTVEQYPDLVELTPAQGPDIQQATIYVDSVKLVDREAAPSLLVMGNFPDGCTHIGQADHQLLDPYPAISITAWRDSDSICTQALVSFSFIYRQLPGEYAASLDSILINSDLYPVNR